MAATINNPPNDQDLLSSLDSSDQHLRDVRLAMEYRYLIKHAPGGVYVLPEMDELRKFHGVIFVRKGLYRDGVFRFRVDLPTTYNSYNTYPLVTFTPPIFNPLIDLSTGKLDLKVDEAFKEWNPDKHFLQSTLTFLKKAFYIKSYDQYSSVPNEDARRLFNEDKDEFLQRVTEAVAESQQRIYDPQPANNTMVFTEPKPAHLALIRDILLNPVNQVDQNHLTTNGAGRDTATSAESIMKKLRQEDESMFEDGSNKLSDHHVSLAQRLKDNEKLMNDDSGDLSADSIVIK